MIKVKNKGLFYFLICLFVFGLGMIFATKVLANGVSLTSDPYSYYYAPNYIKFENVDLFTAYVDFITPTDRQSGLVENGIYEKNNVFYELILNDINMYGENVDLLRFGANNELYFYLDDLYGLSDVDNIVLVWENVVITNNLLDYAPTFGHPYIYNVELSYYMINDSGELLLKNYSYTQNGNNDIFYTLFRELNKTEIVVDKMEIEITSLQSSTTFELLMKLMGGTDRGFYDTDEWIFESNNYEYPTLLGWLIDSISAFLNTPLIGTITIGHLLLIIVCIPLTIALLKFFAGG